VGFGVDDHRIRGLIRFGESISRKWINKDGIGDGGDPFRFRWRFPAQRRFKFFYVLNLSLEKPYYQGGLNDFCQSCELSAHILSKPSSPPSQNSPTFHSLTSLFWWGRQCRP
jgi:hypothetical protein